MARWEADTGQLAWLMRDHVLNRRWKAPEDPHLNPGYVWLKLTLPTTKPKDKKERKEAPQSSGKPSKLTRFHPQHPLPFYFHFSCIQSLVWKKKNYMVFFFFLSYCKRPSYTISYFPNISASFFIVSPETHGFSVTLPGSPLIFLHVPRQVI